MRPLELDQAELGLGPVDAVIAFGVAGDRVVVGALEHRVRPVPPPDLALVAQGGQIRKTARLPRAIRVQDHFAPHRLVQYAFDTCRVGDPEVVDEKLSFGPNSMYHRIATSLGVE